MGTPINQIEDRIPWGFVHSDKMLEISSGTVNQYRE